MRFIDQINFSQIFLGSNALDAMNIWNLEDWIGVGWSRFYNVYQ